MRARHAAVARIIEAVRGRRTAPRPPFVQRTVVPTSRHVLCAPRGRVACGVARCPDASTRPRRVPPRAHWHRASASRPSSMATLCPARRASACLPSPPMPARSARLSRGAAIATRRAAAKWLMVLCRFWPTRPARFSARLPALVTVLTINTARTARSTRIVPGADARGDACAGGRQGRRVQCATTRTLRSS